MTVGENDFFLQIATPWYDYLYACSATTLGSADIRQHTVCISTILVYHYTNTITKGTIAKTTTESEC